MSIIDALAVSAQQEHENHHLCEILDEPTTADSQGTTNCGCSHKPSPWLGRIQLVATWTADVRPTATWSVDSRGTR
jgi:hypothetical protein